MRKYLIGNIKNEYPLSIEDTEKLYGIFSFN